MKTIPLLILLILVGCGGDKTEEVVSFGVPTLPGDVICETVGGEMITNFEHMEISKSCYLFNFLADGVQVCSVNEISKDELELTCGDCSGVCLEIGISKVKFGIDELGLFLEL